MVGKSVREKRDAMPPAVHVLRVVVVLALVAAALWLDFGNLDYDTLSISGVMVGNVLLVTAVGLARRVLWGRTLFVALSALGSLAAALALVWAQVHDLGWWWPYRLVIGHYPTPAEEVVAVVCAVALILLPAAVLGRRTSWYRSEA